MFESSLIMLKTWGQTMLRFIFFILVYGFSGFSGDLKLSHKVIGVSAGGAHNCILDDEGMMCWGSNEEGQIDIPKLYQPKLISLGWYHTCALDSEELKCWG